MANYKLAIVAGHYMNTPGKRCSPSLDPNQTREWWLNNRVATYFQNEIKKYDGITVKRFDDTTGKTDIPLKARTDAANAWGADFYLSFHHNAGVNGGTGGGIVVFVYTGTTDKETLAWQKELYNALIAKTGLKGNRSTPLAKSDLHECRETKMPAVLLELGFMDSKTDVPIILTDDFAKKCAMACVEVVVKHWGLKKKASTSTTTTASATVKTYKVVTTINKYNTAADAKAKKNAKADKLAAGTYYVFSKYPNGVDGMYNISTDKTGASAGSWINPAENVVKTQTETVQKVYRVRKSKDDAKSQAGAYSSLDNAKDACQKAGAGYSVFDWNWKVVYTYEAPKTNTTNTKTEEPKKETSTTSTKKEVAVYDLDYKVKTKIVDKSIKRTNKDCVKAISLIKKNNSKFDENIAKAFFAIAPIYGIDPVWAISQSCLETGWFKYSGSAVTPAHHNYCGLGVTTTGKPGCIFDTIEDGVRAQLQHLYAYGCKTSIPSGEKKVDPRFDLVTRGVATYWEQLAGRWAVPGYDKSTYSTPQKAMEAENTYGQKIRKLYEQITAVSVTNAEVQKYFPTKVEEDKKPEPDTTVKPDTKPEVEPSTDDKDEIDTEKVNTVLGLLEKILTFILDFFTKKK